MRKLELHPFVHRDLDNALQYYRLISTQLEDRFWAEFTQSIEAISQTPERFHIDTFTKLQRYNFKNFPYNILFLFTPDIVRIQALRHNKRKETFGSYRKTD